VAIEDQPSGIDLLRSTLVRAYSAAAENRYLHRLHCVLLMLHGLSSARIAAWFVHDKTTVAGWRRRFERLGLQGLRDQERTGRPAVLDRKQLAELQRVLRRPPPRRAVFRQPASGRASWSLLGSNGVMASTSACGSVRGCFEMPGRLMPQPPTPSGAARHRHQIATVRWRSGVRRRSDRRGGRHRLRAGRAGAISVVHSA